MNINNILLNICNNWIHIYIVYITIISNNSKRRGHEFEELKDMRVLRVGKECMRITWLCNSQKKIKMLKLLNELFLYLQTLKKETHDFKRMYSIYLYLFFQHSITLPCVLLNAYIYWLLTLWSFVIIYLPLCLFTVQRSLTEEPKGKKTKVSLYFLIVS